MTCGGVFLQSVLRKRDQSQAEYEGRLEAAVLRRQEDKTPVSESEEVPPPPPVLRQPLIPCALALQIPLEVERCQDRAECFNADLKADWERWQSDKRRDFRQLLTGLADRNIAHYEKVESECESE